MGCGLTVACDTVEGMTTTPAIRGAEDADWPAIRWLLSVCFGEDHSAESEAMWRTMIPENGTVIACDGADVVGAALFMDLELTVPGGARLPTAGVSSVVVAPTHRRRGVLRAMFAELHQRMDHPIAALTASEGGIYGRFGYGPATIEHGVAVDRREARFHPEVGDPGPVRAVRPVDHRAAFEDVYERWRCVTPGGLHTPSAMWDDVFADRQEARHGGTELFAFLHADGFAFFRVHRTDGAATARVTKFAAVTPQAHAALWRALLGLDLVRTVESHTHPGDVLPYLLTDARLVRTTSVQDDLWLRLRDVPAALAARTYAADLRVVLGVVDDELGAGNRFALTIRDGRAGCTATDAPAEVCLDRSVLGSLYFGAHRASAFAATNRLRCDQDSLIDAMDAAFAGDVPAQLGYGF